MSLSQSLVSAVNNAVDKYIDCVAAKYNLDKTNLKQLWSGSVSSSAPREDSSIFTDEVNEDTLLKSTKVQLKAMCKSKGFKCSGKKSDLIQRLLGVEVKTETKTKSDSSRKAKAKTKAKQSDVINSLVSKVPTISIMRNSHHNLEHPETGLVFDKVTKKVRGKQNDDGSVSELSADDIDLCKKFKFTYNLPENLNKSNLGDVKVNGLEDEDDVSAEESVEESVEENDFLEDTDEGEESEEELYLDD